MAGRGRKLNVGVYALVEETSHGERYELAYKFKLPTFHREFSLHLSRGQRKPAILPGMVAPKSVQRKLMDEISDARTQLHTDLMFLVSPDPLPEKIEYT